MMEKAKSILLGLLVVSSLVQSYLLVYSMPSLEARVKSRQDYVQAEPLGPALETKNMLFPEQIVLHMGEDQHTVFYPDNAPYYSLIFSKLQGREFKRFRQDSVSVVDWDRSRREDQGVELRFGRSIPLGLLQDVFKIEADYPFSRDSIDRIWIFVRKDSEEVRTFFFSADGRSVYESLSADLTVADVETNTDFGAYWTPYQTTDGRIYVPEEPYTRMSELKVAINRYTIDQMQRNLFFDPGVTRAIQERGDGNLIYTDGKRGLKVVERGDWMSYTDPVAPTEGQTNLMDNVNGAVQFVNQHGGWNGMYSLVLPGGRESGNDSVVRFEQHYGNVPIVAASGMTFGYMELKLRQGVVTSYERSLIMLSDTASDRVSRALPGGDALRAIIAQADWGADAISLFPAYRPELASDAIRLSPVWAVRLADGSVRLLAGFSTVPGK